MEPEALEGILTLYSTGTEGGYWAFQDGKFTSQNGYEGLHVLADGDHLTIYDEKGLMVVWMGVIKLIQHRSYGECTSDGIRIHSDQDGVPRPVWEKFFQNKHQAKLIRARR